MDGGKMYRALLLCSMMVVAAGARTTMQSVGHYIYENFQVFSEYHFDAELRNFYFYKSPYYKQHYFLETTLHLDFDILSFKDNVLFVFDFLCINGMGRSPGDIVFDPMDIGYGLRPYLEFRLPWAYAQVGLNHNCYHQIDRQELPTVYFNNPIIAVGSKNMRVQAYASNLGNKKSWTFADRFSWYTRIGYYTRTFFGLAGESKINGINPYVFDGCGEFRYCFYGIGNWFFNARGYSLAGYYRSAPGNDVGEGMAWRQDLFLEAQFRRGPRGGLLFVGTTLDDLPTYPSKHSNARVPRFSYDRMLQIGLKFFL